MSIVIKFPEKQKTCGDCRKYDKCYAMSCEILENYDMEDYEETKKAPACGDFKS